MRKTQLIKPRLKNSLHNV